MLEPKTKRRTVSTRLAAIAALWEIMGKLKLTVSEEKTRICKGLTSWATRSGGCIRRGPAKPVSATGHQRKAFIAQSRTRLGHDVPWTKA
jgi:hypothetical protein